MRGGWAIVTQSILRPRPGGSGRREFPQSRNPTTLRVHRAEAGCLPESHGGCTRKAFCATFPRCDPLIVREPLVGIEPTA